MAMLRAFQGEMRRLNEGGEEFARCFPEQGKMLSLSQVNDRDPYVERLLEGVAYLTAGVRQELKHSIAGLHEQLLESVCPQLIDPYPSTVTLELGLDENRIEGADIIAGTLFYSQPVGNESLSLPFAAQRSIALRAFKLEDFQWVSHYGGGSQLRFKLTGSAAAFRDKHALSPLLLWIDDESGQGYAMREALLRRVDDVEVRLSGAELSASVLRLKDSIYFESAFPLSCSDLFGVSLPGSQALERLQAYFLAREQLLFVNLCGLDQLDLPDQLNSLDITFHLAFPAPGVEQSSRSVLRYGCVPAINLNRGWADPVRLQAGADECLVRSQTDGPDSRVVHRVLQVEGRSTHSGESQSYSALSTWGVDGITGGLYRVVRPDRGSAGRGDPEIRLDPASAKQEQTLSIDVLYSNGDLPRLHLSKGNIDVCSGEVPEGVTVNNLHRPRAFRPAPVETAQTQLLNCLLRCDIERLADKQFMRTLLFAVANAAHSQVPVAVRAIGDIDWQSTTRWRKGVIEQGIKVRMPIDTRHIPDRGEACLLAELIHGVLLEWAPLDRFVELVLVLEPSGEEEQWTNCL
ncbi:type VI secretion system baseplate subunit TssF [Halorhodospira halochloris]|uniref:type VI secretion system baseplate subunit TssF n=1 Tax=Halorhodospira halochloris TaxID=1052 RepID=UPI003084590A